MTAVTAHIGAAPVASTVEPRTNPTDDSRFGAELESARAAIGPDSPRRASGGAPDSPSRSDERSDAETPDTATDRTGGTVSSGTGAPVSDPTPAATAADPATAAAPSALPTGTTVALGSPAVFVASPVTGGTSAAAPTGPNAADAMTPTEVAGPARLAKVHSTAPVDTSVASAEPTTPGVSQAVASPGIADSAKKSETTEHSTDAATPAPAQFVAASMQPVAPVPLNASVPPVAPVTLPAPSVSVDAPPQISVAPAAASGPMLPAAATEKPTPTADVAPPGPNPAPVLASTAPVAPPAPLPLAAPLAPAAPTDGGAPRQADPPLVPQLARPLAALRAAGDGNHIITISVTPENLGPVTVRAHVSGDAVRIELVAPTEQARDALKAIMPDLRRDLSQSGGQLSLDLSSGNQPSGREWLRDSADGNRARDSRIPAVATSLGAPIAVRSESALDVLV